MERKIEQQTLEKKYLHDLVFKSLGTEGKFSGYASIFNIVDSYNDIIKPRAFTKTLQNHNAVEEIKLLWQHSPEEPIGVFETIKEDTVGLYVEGKLLLEVKRAQEAYALIKSGAVSGLSIGYNTRKATIDRTSGVRTIYEVDLWEVSVVTFPANAYSNIIYVKQDLGAEANENEVQKFLRSVNEVKRILT